MGRLGRLFGFGERALTPQQAYALWADSYPPRAHNPLMESEQSVVEPILRSLTPARALDVGTGTGRCMPILAATGARVVVGVDMSMPMLGRNADGRPRVCADARRLPFPDGSFDVICSSLMAGDIQHPSEWIGEAARVLAPGGHLVYSDFHPAGTSRGWRRTFRTAEGRVRELSFFRHTIEQHLHLLEQAALVVRAIREPRLERQAPPVVVVFHAFKRC
jgi:ubiquinone/menaquinone biosynthesis C-methylase UbiE